MNKIIRHIAVGRPVVEIKVKDKIVWKSNKIIQRRKRKVFIRRYVIPSLAFAFSLISISFLIWII